MVGSPHFVRQSTGVPHRHAVTDALSDVFDLVAVHGLVTGGFAVHGPWISHGTISRPFKLIALVAGAARVGVDGPGGPIGPVELSPGDVVLLNHRTRLEVQGGRGDGPPTELVPQADFDSIQLAEADLDTDDVLIGGWIQVSPAGIALLGAALPGLVHVRAATSAACRVRDLVERLFEEAS